MNYEFPFDELSNRNFTRVFIFGAGEIGALFQTQISKQGRVSNLGFVDNFITTESSKIDIVSQIGVHRPEFLRTVEYDCVVLACAYTTIPEICDSLFRVGVESRKIILPRIKTSYFTPDIGDEWNDYYGSAEISANGQIEKYFIPLLSKHEISLCRVLDFPSGRGRIAESMYKIYAEQIEKFVCCDANSEAVDFCRKRFADKNIFDYMINKVDEWECVPFDF